MFRSKENLMKIFFTFHRSFSRPAVRIYSTGQRPYDGKVERHLAMWFLGFHFSVCIVSGK